MTIHGHGRARPATKSDGVPARAACDCAIGGTLLPSDGCAFRRVRVQRNDTVPCTRELARADGTAGDDAI